MILRTCSASSSKETLFFCWRQSPLFRKLSESRAFSGERFFTPEEIRELLELVETLSA
ncbi:MAG: hypothetical protein L0Y71_00910 [Gemmataceae bacterium]|nr:hypothetical protein [Gemmataceae bacterium]